MRQFAVVLLILAATGPLQAAGILIPKEKEVPPLAMLSHRVTITIEDQVAVTRVEQTFRNHTDRRLEATYVFPVPKHASVRKFAMWVGGKKVTGELVEAKKARDMYNSIVQRTMEPGLLEFVGHKMFKMRVFPIPPNGDQKIAFSYTSVVPKDNQVVNYTYPLKTDGKAIKTLEKFTIQVKLKSQHSIQNIYSPSHAIRVTRTDDKHANIEFGKDEAMLDRNFQLYYTAGTKDVGLTALTHRPVASDKGYFLMLISPRAKLAKDERAPRDVVFVLDTSGSMRGKRITQAQNALKYCLGKMNEKDRFAIIQFATAVNKYSESWLKADGDQITQAKKWVDGLSATGGTAINDALISALKMRAGDKSRTFTVVFFTDGQPTIGETKSDKILRNVLKQNSANTRIFTFGVGDNVNATMLDQLSEESRAVSTYVREAEDIEQKVGSLYAKISQPVLTDLKLKLSDNVRLMEVYPQQLPDLFHGSQLVVLGRYDGSGAASVKLTGRIGKKQREFTYETKFAKKTQEDRPFVEDLWARRKVGFLLDQIRRNGEKKELVTEVITLAKRYGITTPYTSYLIVPDAPTTVAATRRPLFRQRLPDVRFGAGGAKSGKKGTAPAVPGVLKGKAKTEKTSSLKDYVKRVAKEGGLAKNRGAIEEYRLQYADNKDEKGGAKSGRGNGAAQKALQQKTAFDRARGYFARRKLGEVQNGRLGVDLSVWNNQLRCQSQVCRTAVQRVTGRNVVEVGGVWIDENFKPKMKTITIKAMSKAYFQILLRQPKMKKLFQLGNHLVWVAPNGTALIVDTAEGRTAMTDAEIDKIFQTQKKRG